MCPQATINVSSQQGRPGEQLYVHSYYYICPHTTVYVSSYYYINVLTPLHVCPHFFSLTTVYVSSYWAGVRERAAGLLRMLRSGTVLHLLCHH
jgi:hypothetical protein